MGAKRIWTEKRLQQLKDYCSIGDGMGFKVDEIARRMNLKPKQIKDAMCNYGIKNGRGGFKKGRTPWNKGKKWKNGSKSVHSGCFKPGYQNPNKVPDGTISCSRKKTGRVDWRIKINGKWISYMKHLWESENGLIPKNHIVVIIDSNLPISLENIELITRREFIKRNINPKKSAETQKKIRARDKELYNAQNSPWYLKPDKLSTGKKSRFY